MVIMRKASLAHAKAHLSKIVDFAEHRGKSTMILRHGKPVAAIVPVAAALPPKRRRTHAQSLRTVQRSVRAFVEEFSAAEPTVSAVEDLRRGRR